MPDPISVGVFTDAGGPHLGAYFTALRDCPEAGEIVLSDPSGDSVASARKILGDKLAAVYGDAGNTLSKAPPSMALISLEARHAPPVIERALDAGCHVLAEKPACIESKTFTRLAQQADQQGKHLMLALANRLNPPVLKAMELIQAQTFGRPYGVEIHMIADQTRLTRPSYHESWYADRDRSGGGHLVWLGIHWLDLAMLFLNSPIREVSGFAANIGGQPIAIEDSAVLSMRFENGVLGTMTSGYYLDRGYHSHLRIWGSKGWLEYADWLGGPNPVPLRWYTAGEGAAEYQGPREPRGYSPWVRECVRASAGLRKPPITTQEGLRVLRTIFAFYDAARSGRSLAV